MTRFWLGGTLFDHVTTDMKIYKEEIFGPVLSCVRVPDFATAVQIINDHELGNGVSCFTRDGNVAREFARRIQVGKRLTRQLEPSRLAKSTTAMAGLTGAVSAATAAAAAIAAPSGLTAISVAVGLTSAPLIVTAAPVVAGAAVVVGTTAGLVRFYAWYKEEDDQEQPVLKDT